MQDKKRPESLTVQRAFDVLPSSEIDEEWLRKKKAGELPLGFAGTFGSLKTIWPEEKLTKEEKALAPGYPDGEK